jgi:hypothetical protein
MAMAGQQTVSEANRDSCDFCRSMPATRGYLCNNFSLNGVPVFRKASGTWMACQRCAELVNAGEWSALVERCYQSFAARHKVTTDDVNSVGSQFSELVTEFAAHCRIES